MEEGSGREERKKGVKRQSKNGVNKEVMNGESEGLEKGAGKRGMKKGVVLKEGELPFPCYSPITALKHPMLRSWSQFGSSSSLVVFPVAQPPVPHFRGSH